VRGGDWQLVKAKVISLAAAVLVPLLLVGCGGGGGGGGQGGGSRSAAQQKLCDSLQSLNKALAELDNLQPQTASTADIQAAATKVREANKETAAAAEAVSSSEVDSVTIAATRLVTAAKNVPPGTSAQKALQQVEPALQATKTQFQATYNGLSCGPVSE
jgi:DNA repair ATPase RecN